jgi:drug/metabolite transporter (DMT)-like permease
MNPGRGIALKVASTFVFTLMLVCVKAVADTIPPGEIVFARSFFAVLPILVVLAWQGQVRDALKTERPWLHVSRGAIGLGSMALNFASLAYLPLPENMAIGYAAPLIVVVLAALMLGETIRLFRWTAVCIGFAGILVILWPRFSLLSGGSGHDLALLGSMLAVVGTFFAALVGIFVRNMTRTEATGTIVLYFALSSSALSLVSLPFGWAVPDLTDAVLLVLTGLLGGVGQILMTSAYRHAPAATVASFDYVSILWGVALGYVLFGEAPTRNVLVGGAIVVAAGIIIIFRERALGLERKRQREATPLPPG